MNTRRLTAAAVAGLAVLLTSCTTPPAQDPAAQAAIAYYTSIDQRTTEQCDLAWRYRTDPAGLAQCKASPVGGYASIVGTPTVDRLTEFAGPLGGPGRAVVLKMQLKEGSAIYAVALAEDQGRWFWVKEESLPSVPTSDEELVEALR